MGRARLHAAHHGRSLAFRRSAGPGKAGKSALEYRLRGLYRNQVVLELTPAQDLTPSDGLRVLQPARATFLILTRHGTAVGPGVEEPSRDGRAEVAGSSRTPRTRRTPWRAAARPPTPANTSRIAPENGDPNGDPIRYQKRSQRVTRHPTGLVGPEVTNRQAQRGISAFGGAKKWWTGGELNSRHRDFQSRALPTELPVHRALCEDRLKRP